MSKPSDQQILHQDGFDVVLKQWNDIMVLALTDAEKTERCVAIVQDHIDHLKERNAQKKNPVLRLSADLIILSELLNSECEVGKVCESGARSAGRLVGLLLFGSSVMLQPNLDLTDSLSVDLKKPDRDWRYPRKGVAEYWEVAR